MDFRVPCHWVTPQNCKGALGVGPSEPQASQASGVATRGGGGAGGEGLTSQAWRVQHPSAGGGDTKRDLTAHGFCDSTHVFFLLQPFTKLRRNSQNTRS